MEQARKLINGHQFNNEPIRVLISSLGSGLRATDAFLVSTLSKHLLRETRLADAAVNNPDALRFNVSQRRYGLPGSVKADPDDAPDEDEDIEASAVMELEKSKLPTKPNPLNVAVYGQILLAARSYQSALCKYRRLQCMLLLTLHSLSLAGVRLRARGSASVLVLGNRVGGARDAATVGQQTSSYHSGQDNSEVLRLLLTVNRTPGHSVPHEIPRVAWDDRRWPR